MLFNSLEYMFFLPAVFVSYWSFKNNRKAQNIILLVSSYIFYGWWDWRFLSLILLSTVVDFYMGLKINDSQNNKVRKSLLYVSILFNLSLLGFFKYYNFFIESWIDLISSIGYEPKSVWTLNVILPVGISFYTFQTMSYSLDVYFKKIKPTKDFISFASFVSFFPQLVAGPIERASRLLPQILNSRKFNYKQSSSGLRLILWGMFKKVVIADSLAVRVDSIFDNYYSLDGGILLLGLIYFSFQIYCDFSGYSDMAIGTAKLFGIELMSNFKFPYFSRNIGEFWRRWHISLSTWFRDYLYIPLGGSKKGRLASLRNIFIIFVVSGFWHGANWTFIFWGIFHTILFLPLFILNQNRRFTSLIVAENSALPSIKEFFQMFSTFLQVMIIWVFFRSPTLSDSFNYLSRLFKEFSITNLLESKLIYVIIFVSIDWLWRKNERDPLKLENNHSRFLLYTLIFYAIILNLNNENQFIYFQF